MDMLKDRVRRFEDEKTEIKKHFRMRANETRKEIKSKRKEFKNWKNKNIKEAKRELYKKNQVLKAEELKVLTLRRSMMSAERELKVMHKDGDYKTDVLDETTNALGVVENSLFIINQELGSLRTYLEDFPQRLNTCALKLRNDASDYNDIVTLQNDGLDASKLEEALEVSFLLELKNIYERMISWVLLARQSFATYTVMGNIETSAMTNNLDELKENFRRANYISRRNLDSEIAVRSSNLRIDDMIANQYSKEFDFEMDNVKTGMETMCEWSEGGSNVTDIFPEESETLFTPICEKLVPAQNIS
jgi:hypothetical protein